MRHSWKGNNFELKKGKSQRNRLEFSKNDRSTAHSWHLITLHRLYQCTEIGLVSNLHLYAVTPWSWIVAYFLKRITVSYCRDFNETNDNESIIPFYLQIFDETRCKKRERYISRSGNLDLPSIC